MSSHAEVAWWWAARRRSGAGGEGGFEVAQAVAATLDGQDVAGVHFSGRLSVKHFTVDE